MKRKLFASLLAGSLYLGACSDEQPKTFVVDQLQLEDEEIGIDFNGDALVDNRLPDWVSTWSNLGFDLPAKFDTLVSRGEFLFAFDFYDFVGDEDDLMFGYRSTIACCGFPRFDTTDAIVPTNEFFQFNNLKLTKGSGPPFDKTEILSATASHFDWPLIPFDSDELITLPLENVHFQASLHEDSTMNGFIAGTIQAIEIAKIMERIPAAFDALQLTEAREFNNGGEPIACDGDTDVCGLASFCADQLADGVSTGFCVSADSTTELALSFLDDGGDGRFVVDFDESTNLFVRNDLAPLFDLQPGANPSGIFGLFLFDLDLDHDGFFDAFSVAVGFDGVSAIRAQ
jgi:hypothetical protein